MSGGTREAFARSGFADVTELIPAGTRACVAAEAIAALDAHSVRRDIRVDATGGSPRRYRVVDRDTLAAACPTAAALYHSDLLLERIGAIAGEALAPVPYVPEELIATRLERAGDTHGWHWDDYAFALVWVLRAPPAGSGADLEYVTGVPWHKDAPQIDAILAGSEPVRAHVAAGTVYLLRTDTTLHRVTPLRFDAQRDALCFSYAAVRDLDHVVTHETLAAILASAGAHA
jgi:hypothetical protein